MSKKQTLLIVVAFVLGVFVFQYNSLQFHDEQLGASWSEITNQYQRRFDLIPNLVNTVKGFAAHEKEIFLRVTQARAKVGSVQMTPEFFNDSNAFTQFQQAQKELSGTLARLLAVAENYPQLKSDRNFLDLQAQLEGTENRITVARNRYVQAVKDYNTKVRTFPANVIAKIFGFKVKANFTVENESQIAKPVNVDFEIRANNPS